MQQNEKVIFILLCKREQTRTPELKNIGLASKSKKYEKVYHLIDQLAIMASAIHQKKWRQVITCFATMYMYTKTDTGEKIWWEFLLHYKSCICLGLQ